MTQETQNIERLTGRSLWLRRFFAFVMPLLVIGGAIAAVMVMSAMKPEPEEKEDVVKALPVLTSQAVTENVTLSVTAQGEVQPRTQINVVPQVSGRITYMSPKFIEGGVFNKGDLLIRVEPAEYELRVVQARANVAQAETSLTREKSESDIARKDWEELGTGGAPSALTLREPQMAEAGARLEAAKAQLAEAELQLRRTQIYAPFSGRVTERFVNQGAYVTTGAQIGEIYSTDIMDVRLPLTNQDLGRAGLKLGFQANRETPGVPVKLSADVAGVAAEWNAIIVRTDSRFDPDTRQLYAYAEVKDPFGKAASNGTPLAPGIYVNAEIRGEDVGGAVVIPRAGLRGKDQVYVASSDDTLEIRSVSVRASDRDKAILIAGLNAGEWVVTSPIRGAADGMKVDVVDDLNSGADAESNAQLAITEE